MYIRTNNMLPEGALVSAKLGDHQVKCCGIRVNNWIITHGTLLLPAIARQLHFYSDEIKFDVLIQKHNLVCKNSNFKTHIVNETAAYKATLENVFENEYLADVVQNEFSVWLNVKDENEVKALPLFLLLRIQEFSCDGTIAFENELLYLGMDLLIESTPFSISPFFNSWSRGIISKILDSQNQVALIDTRSTVGIEGAPVFSCNKDDRCNLVGMVICVLGYNEKSNVVGLTLGCSIFPVLKYFAICKNVPTLIKEKNVLDIVKSAVVHVRCGNNWGSGVVINAAKGVILTCSHNINSESPVFVSHKVFENKKQLAAVVYATPKHIPYDLAVLKIAPHPSLTQLAIKNSSRLPTKGEHILSAGYSLLPEYNAIGLELTISQGCVANYSKGGPLHITSSVHSGASGGAILQLPNQLLGIIICNSKVLNTVYPEFSMGLSVVDFHKPVNTFLETSDSKHLKELSINNKEIATMWDIHSTSKL